MAENVVRKKLKKIGEILSATLTAGSTSVVLSNSIITTESLIDIYTDDYNIAPTAAEVVAGKITLTFEAQSKAVKIKVEVKNG